MVKTVSQSEYARQRGVTPGYINKLVKYGVLKLQDGKIDPVRADADIKAYAAQLHDTPGPKGSNPSANDDSLAAWRKKELQVKTAIRRLELEESTGKLINIEELRTELAKLFVNLKTVLRALPSKVAGEIFHLAKNAKTEREAMAGISKYLLKEVDAALLELSNWKPTKDKEVKGFKKGKGHRARNK